MLLESYKEKKFPRPDSITAELIKHLGPIGKKFLLNILNQN